METDVAEIVEPTTVRRFGHVAVETAKVRAEARIEESLHPGSNANAASRVVAAASTRLTA
jgi:hypothetical protein